MENYRVVNGINGNVYITNSLIQGGEVELSELSNVRSIAIFYKGAGEQLKLVVDFSSGRLKCVQVKSGYHTILFDKRVKFCVNNILTLYFTSNWIQVSLGGKYVGSSFLEGESAGYIRVDTSPCLTKIPVQFIQEGLEPKFNSLFLGDGFTGGNWPHVDYWMWPDLLFGGEVFFVNAGVSAANTRKAFEISDDFKKFTSIKYRSCFLMLGVDDVIDRISFSESVRNYSKIVNNLLLICDQLYVCTLTPRMDDLNDEINLFNQHIASFNDNNKIKVIDVASAFANLEIESYIYEDDFPNKKGQELIAQTVASVLDIPIDYSLKVSLNQKKNYISKFLMYVSNKFRGAAGKFD